MHHVSLLLLSIMKRSKKIFLSAAIALGVWLIYRFNQPESSSPAVVPMELSSSFASITPPENYPVRASAAPRPTPEEFQEKEPPAPLQIQVGSEKEQLLLLNTKPIDDETPGAYWVLFNEWAQRSPQEAAENIDLAPAGMRMTLAGLIVTAWAGQAPQDAIAWAANQEHLGHRYHAIQTTLDAWSKTQPTDAYLWAIQNLDQAEMKDAFSIWCKNDPENATAALLAMPEGDETFWEYLRLATDALFTNSPEKAVRLIEQAGFPADEIDRMQAAFNNWYNAHPKEATGWLEAR